jgi:glycogen debranching enzyme
LARSGRNLAAEVEIASGWRTRASTPWPIDGHGKPCRVRGSNPGHLLFSGLPSPERARKVIDTLLSSAFHNGLGRADPGPGEPRFNPMSYHNGSVWPHDTAICAMGLARYGERDGVVRMTSGLFETAAHYEMRLPELFCGFRASGRASRRWPIRWPACPRPGRRARPS